MKVLLALLCALGAPAAFAEICEYNLAGSGEWVAIAPPTEAFDTRGLFRVLVGHDAAFALRNGEMVQGWVFGNHSPEAGRSESYDVDLEGHGGAGSGNRSLRIYASQVTKYYVSNLNSAEWDELAGKHWARITGSDLSLAILIPTELDPLIGNRIDIHEIIHQGKDGSVSTHQISGIFRGLQWNFLKTQVMVRVKIGLFTYSVKVKKIHSVEIQLNPGHRTGTIPYQLVDHISQERLWPKSR